MKVVIDPVDTYLMLSGKDPYAYQNIVDNTEYQVFIDMLSKTKKKKSASK